MNQSIDLSPQDAALIAGSLANDQARIERLIAKLSAPGEKAAPSRMPIPSDPQPIEQVRGRLDALIPTPGQPWLSQGGIYAGALPALDGQGIEHLVLGDWFDGEFKWGNYGKDIPGASSLKDGKANTRAMLAAQSPAATIVEKRNTSAGDFSDWHIPSQQEAHLLAATCFEQMDQAVIWTSSLYSADYAWYQGFSNGDSSWDGKDSSLRVRPVRRFKL